MTKPHKRRSASFPPHRGPKTSPTPATDYPLSEGFPSITMAEISFGPFLCRPLSRADPRLSPGISSRHRVNRTHSGRQAIASTPPDSACSAREALSPTTTTTTTADASLELLFSRPLSRADLRLSPRISSRRRVNRTYSGRQARGLTPIESLRSSHAHGMGKTEISAHPPQQGLAQYLTGAGAGAPLYGTDALENTNSPIYDMDTTADVDVRGHDTAAPKPPVFFAGFEDGLNDNFDFVSSLECMPRDLPDTAGMWTGLEACSKSKKMCMIFALKILQTLHIPPPACLSACDETSIPSRRQPRMIDTVLSTNKEVAQSVSDILICPCSLSSQVQLVLTIICGKLMAWNRAVVRSGSDSSDSPFSPSSSSSPSLGHSVANTNASNKDQTERVLHKPITLGEYSFGAALEGKLRAQVVFSELQQLEGLVEKLSGRIQEAQLGNPDTAAHARKANASTPAPSTTPATTVAVDLDFLTPPATPPDETGVTDATHPSLSSFLRKQLQAAKEETTRILGDERGGARWGFKGKF